MRAALPRCSLLTWTGDNPMEQFQKAAAFLEKIGLKVSIVNGVTGFLPGIFIKEGEILVSAEDDDLAGDMLHEGGHLAVTPSIFRDKITGDIESVGSIYDQILAEDRDHDDALIRAILQSGEGEAIAWSFAAARAAGVDTRLPFWHFAGNDGEEVHSMLAAGCHCGIHGLAAAGMTEIPRLRRQHAFPEMKRWLQI
jgi:hypothetical protein